MPTVTDFVVWGMGRSPNDMFSNFQEKKRTEIKRKLVHTGRSQWRSHLLGYIIFVVSSIKIFHIHH